MKNKICTSLEQSQKLIELGIDVNTADMFWDTLFAKKPEAQVDNHNLVDEYDDEHRVPAWSLTALLKLMPPYLFEFERGIDLNIYPNLNGKGWHCSYMPNNIENMKKDKFKQITNGDNPVDAAVEMICWLKKYNKL